MSYKNENLKHAQGVASAPKYACPKCKQPFSINKLPFMIVCSKCKSVVEKDDILIKTQDYGIQKSTINKAYR